MRLLIAIFLFCNSLTLQDFKQSATSLYICNTNDCKRLRRIWKRRHVFETINNTTPWLNLSCSATSGLTSAVNGEIKKKNKTKNKTPLKIIDQPPASAFVDRLPPPRCAWAPSSHPRCSGWLFHVSRPIRVSLADRKEWRTNTTGFGPEWRSNTWRMEGGMK